MATLDPEVVAANARLPLLLLVAGLASACVASAARSWGQFALAAVLGPGHAACCFAAASALLWRTRHSGLRGGGFASAGLAAALAAEAVACFGELGPPLSLSAASPAGEHAAGASALLHSMAVAPAGLALRALSRALYAAASARWLGEIRPVSWSSATAMCTIPAAALVGCAQLAIDDSAAASLAAHAGAEPGCAPLEQDPHYGGLALDAAGAAALVGACTLRVATAWLAPRASRARAPPGGGAAAAALVPASHAIDEARQLRAKLGALLPLALAAALALVAALGRLRFSAVGLTDPADGASGLGGSAAWASALERADWEAWVRLSLVLLDAAVALVVVWLAMSALLDGSLGAHWAGSGGGVPHSLADLQAGKERRRARAPVIQDAEPDLWDADATLQAKLDPNLVRDEDGDLAHEFWRAVTAGRFEKAQVAAAQVAAQQGEPKAEGAGAEG